jgi:hypothetical protein
MLALSACTAPVKKSEDSSVIRERSVERWNLIIAHQPEKAYDYLTPGFRATKTREEYARETNARGVRWDSVTYSSQECSGDTCKVYLGVGYKLPMGGPAGTVKSVAPRVETWLLVDGRWYFLPDPVRSTKPGQDKDS